MPLVRQHVWRILGFVALAAWALSLVLPVGGSRTGMDIARIGWMAVIMGDLGFLANFSVIFGVLLLVLPRIAKPWSSLLLAAFSAIASYSAALWNGVIPSDNMGAISLRPFGAGYYLWFLAVIVAGFSPAAREVCSSLGRKDPAR